VRLVVESASRVQAAIHSKELDQPRRNEEANRGKKKWYAERDEDHDLCLTLEVPRLNRLAIGFHLAPN
jgi:hypothetical protein